MSLDILRVDPWLKPHEGALNRRMERYAAARERLGDSLANFANGAMYFGFHRTHDGWVYREWAPRAESVHLIGDFNNWDRESHPLTPLKEGVWEINLAGHDTLKHESFVKVLIEHNGRFVDRIPTYIRRVVQDPASNDYSGQIWAPDVPFAWKNNAPKPAKSPLIYECHVGMAREEGAIGSYLQFAQDILPRIIADGYNTIQIMAVMEHPYYASFGYQVTNFYAVSSWFGNPDEFKALVDTAHGYGLTVLLDLVHSHAAPNAREGIAQFDGTEYQFFHKGARGNHSAWGSKLFDYAEPGVEHFLLSNIKFWLDEYRLDGFRFDGVTSMLYKNHGLGMAFSSYNDYFSANTDEDAVTYLQLANTLINEIRPDAISIAEDMSGMPGMVLPIASGGFGFDYRLAMGVPDLWIKYLKERRDENWDMWNLWHELTTRRPSERNIAYAESHDQALVGDKTLIFRMADAKMYTEMSVFSEDSDIIRAIALIKMIKFVTLTLGGEGYLNFMGNEFGHPEWIDFPREGNDWSFAHCRRQWHLESDDVLKYKYMAAFDRDMLSFVKEHGTLSANDLQNLWMDNERGIMAFRKSGIMFLFNFHPTVSLPGFFLPVPMAGKYITVFDSDAQEYGGYDRVSREVTYNTVQSSDRGLGIAIYAPNRTVIALKRV